MKIVWHWLIISGIVYATTFILPGQIVISPFYIIFVVGACLMFIHMVIEPVINLLALPMNIMTLGLFAIGIHAAIFYYLPYIIGGFHVYGIKAAFVGSFTVSIGDWLLGKIFR